MKRRHLPGASLRTPQRGLSIVELMIGVTVGLFVIAGSITLMVENMRSNRQNMLATRVNQDLRAAADLVARDLRRAGYWQNAISGLGAAAAASNPHWTLTVGGTSTAGTFAYSYAKNTDNTLDAAEQFGFSLVGNVLQYQPSSGSGAQPITDRNVVKVSEFSITEATANASGLDLYELCACYIRSTCAATDFTATGGTYNNATYRPRVFVRQYTVLLRGESALDSKIKRELKETVRVRNDRLSGTCPDV